jgi:hypothetical protein
MKINLKELLFGVYFSKFLIQNNLCVKPHDLYFALLPLLHRSSFALSSPRSASAKPMQRREGAKQRSEAKTRFAPLLL